MLQGLGVMHAEVFDVEHAEALGLQYFHRLAQSGRITARKNALSDPCVEGPGTIAADVVKETASGVADGAADRAAEITVMIKSNVLQHTDGTEDIKLLAHATVVVFDEIDAAGDALALRPFARIHDLLMRDVEGLHPDAVALRHVNGQRSPAAAGFYHGFAGLQPKLATDHFELGLLRRFERGLGPREIGTGVKHALVEPQAVKVVGQVVVALDVGARATRRVGLEPVKPLGAQPSV